MNLKRASAALLCISSALCAAGCASSSSTSNRGGASLSSRGAAQSNARPGASPTAEGKAQSPLPAPTGFVNDFAKVIGAETKAALEAKLARLKESERIELAVLTVETTGGQNASDYSLAVAKDWGIGPPKGEEGGGVLLMLAVKDRAWWIQVSRSLEADLPNETTVEIGRQMTPHLRQANFDAGVTAGVEGLVRRLAERRGFNAEEILKD